MAKIERTRPLRKTNLPVQASPSEKTEKEEGEKKGIGREREPYLSPFNISNSAGGRNSPSGTIHNPPSRTVRDPSSETVYYTNPLLNNPGGHQSQEYGSGQVYSIGQNYNGQSYIRGQGYEGGCEGGYERGQMEPVAVNYYGDTQSSYYGDQLYGGEQYGVGQQYYYDQWANFSVPPRPTQ